MRFHILGNRTKTLLLGLLVFLAVAAYVPNVANAEAPAVEMTSTGRVVQVNLPEHAKISQYADINSSARGYGMNACGLVAAAAAWGGTDWVELVDELAQAAGQDYGKHTGIQPSRYVAALQKVFGDISVSATDKSTLDALYQELSRRNIVIVDIQVNANTEFPSTASPNYAHFARVLGIDTGRQEIYIENTLSGAPYWTVSFETFMRVWEYPETKVSLIPDPRNAEAVTRWMVVLDNAPLI